MISRNGGERDELAPVIPLFGGPPPTTPHAEESERSWHASWIDDAGERTDASAQPGAPAPAGDASDAAADIEQAERALLRRLRGRSLSVSEARALLRDRDVAADDIETLIVRFEALGYLDDALLAEQLVHVGADRKGQGRRAIAQTMSARGLPRELVDAVLVELPDDDAERALDFARGKAKSMASLDRDTALRRLTGQLARRGYAGSTAMSAARAALDELQGPSTGVRFR